MPSSFVNLGDWLDLNKGTGQQIAKDINQKAAAASDEYMKNAQDLAQRAKAGAASGLSGDISKYKYEKGRRYLPGGNNALVPVSQPVAKTQPVYVNRTQQPQYQAVGVQPQSQYQLASQPVAGRSIPGSYSYGLATQQQPKPAVPSFQQAPQASYQAVGVAPAAKGYSYGQSGTVTPGAQPGAAGALGAYLGVSPQLQAEQYVSDYGSFEDLMKQKDAATGALGAAGFGDLQDAGDFEGLQSYLAKNYGGANALDAALVGGAGFNDFKTTQDKYKGLADYLNSQGEEVKQAEAKYSSEKQKKDALMSQKNKEESDAAAQAAEAQRVAREKQAARESGLAALRSNNLEEFNDVVKYLTDDGALDEYLAASPERRQEIMKGLKYTAGRNTADAKTYETTSNLGRIYNARKA